MLGAGRGARGLPWRTLGGAGLAAAFVLVALRLAAHAPRPLLVTLAVGWMLACVPVPWLSGSDRSAWRARLAVLLAVWLLGSAGLLAGVRSVDPGGWTWLALTGHDEVRAESLPRHETLSDFVRAHPQFVRDEALPGVLRLPAGRHDLDETVLVPGGAVLVIEAGAELRFGPGRSLVSRSPILARGRPEAPIRFRARNPWLKWGAVGIVEAGPSLFEYVRFEDARFARVNGIDLPGALSMIRSDVQVSRAEFTNLYGKDALYVQEGRAIVQSSIFRDTYRDGLDFDGGEGLVRSNRFLDCGDEALDLSATSRVEVVDNEIRDSRGGRVAVETGLEGIRSHNRFGYSEGREG